MRTGEWINKKHFLYLNCDRLKELQKKIRLDVHLIQTKSI